MNPLVKQILQYLIMLGLGIFLMWLVFRDLNFDLIVTGFQEANYWWISAALIVSLVAHYSRAVRWKLLMEPLGYSPSNFHTFLAVMTGYFANSLLPRAGEVSRCYVLKRTDNIPFNIAFGSVVAERVIDVICLLIMTALAFFIEFDHIKDFFYQLVMDKVSGTEASMQKLYVVLGIIAAAGALILFLLYKFREALLSISIIAKVYQFILGLLDGMTSVWKLKRKWEFLFHTFLIWFCYYFMMYVIFFALPSTAGLSLGAALVVMVVGGFGMSAPVTAGMGAYHFMVAAALQLYGVALEQGKVFAIISHSSQTISLIIFGGICALLSFSLKPKAVVEDGNQTQNS